MFSANKLTIWKFSILKAAQTTTLQLVYYAYWCLNDPPIGPEMNFQANCISYYTPWPNKNASILFGIIFQKIINKNEKLFHDNNK